MATMQKAAQKNSNNNNKNKEPGTSTITDSKEPTILWHKTFCVITQRVGGGEGKGWAT